MIHFLAEGADSGTGAVGVGGIAGAAAGVLIALIAAISQNMKNKGTEGSDSKTKRGKKVVPEPPPITAVESAANLNLLNLQKMYDGQALEYKNFREETDRSENEVRAQTNAEIEWRDNIIFQIEEEFLKFQDDVLRGDAPPFKVRKPRPPRPNVRRNPPAGGDVRNGN